MFSPVISSVLFNTLSYDARQINMSVDVTLEEIANGTIFSFATFIARTSHMHHVKIIYNLHL